MIFHRLNYQNKKVAIHFALSAVEYKKYPLSLSIKTFKQEECNRKTTFRF